MPFHLTYNAAKDLLVDIGQDSKLYQVLHDAQHVEFFQHFSFLQHLSDIYYNRQDLQMKANYLGDSFHLKHINFK